MMGDSTARLWESCVAMDALRRATEVGWKPDSNGSIGHDLHYL